MPYQFKIFSNPKLLLEASKCGIYNEMTRKLSCILKRNHDINIPKIFKKSWQDDLQLLFKLPNDVPYRSFSKKTDRGYHIKTITSNDKECVIMFLRRLFARDEPLLIAIQLLDPNDPNSRCTELEEYAAAAIDDGISLAAVDKNEEIIGMVINGFIRRTDVIDKDIVEKCQNQKFKKVLRVLTHLSTCCQIWEHVPKDCNTVVGLKIASTDPKWRGKQIMKVLAKETEQLAKKHGACGIHMDATSAFSARAAERLGYKKIYSVMYTDIPDGPRPEPPHVEAKVYLKLIP